MPSSLFKNSQAMPTMATTATTESNFQPPANLGQIKNFMNMVQSSGNPQAMFQNLLASNPQIGKVMEIVNQYGGDPKAAFYALAKQKGVDPNQVLNLLK